MKNTQFIRLVGSNQRGGMAALLSVVVLSMVIVTALSSVYIYLENRAKFQGRIRLSYQVTYSMEELARIMSQGYDIANANGGTCGSTGMTLVQVDGFYSGTTTNPVGICIPPGTDYTDGSGNVCVTNSSIINSNDPDHPNRFCLTTAVTGGGGPSESLYQMKKDSMFAKASLLDKWYSRLNKFFDTTVTHNAPKAQDVAWNILESEFQPPTYLGWMFPMNSKKAWAGYLNPAGEVEPVINNEGEQVAVEEELSLYDQMIHSYNYVTQTFFPTTITNTESETRDPAGEGSLVNIEGELDPNQGETPIVDGNGQEELVVNAGGETEPFDGTGILTDWEAVAIGIVTGTEQIPDHTDTKAITTGGSTNFVEGLCEAGSLNCNTSCDDPPCETTQPSTGGVRIVTNACDGAEVTDSGECVRCKTGVPGATTANSPPCFELIMNNPFLIINDRMDSTGGNRSTFRLPVRLIR